MAAKPKIPYYLTKEYYVEKIPLYLRQGYEQGLLDIFKFVTEKTWYEFQNLNESKWSSLLLYEKENSDNLLDRFFNENSKDQKLLTYFLEDKRKDDVSFRSKPIKYYKFLVHVLSNAKLLTKSDWFELLKQLELINFVRFKIEPDGVVVRLNQDLDILTKLIFQNIINYPFKVKEIKIDTFRKEEIIDTTFYIYKFNQDNKEDKQLTSYFNTANFWFDGNNILIDLLETND